MGPRRATRSRTERRVALSGAFLAGARSRPELARRLRQSLAALQALGGDEQSGDERPTDEALALVAADVVARAREQLDEQANALVARCLGELLRVFSPSVRFLAADEDRAAALRCMLSALRALGDARQDQEASTGVLEVMNAQRAAVATLLLPLQGGSEESEPPAAQLVAALMEAAGRKLPRHTQELALDLMLGCLQDDELLDQALMDAVLAPLLLPPAARPADEVEPEEERDHDQLDKLPAESGPYELAKVLIRRASDALQTPLAQFFNGVLIDAPAGLLTSGAPRESRLKEHVHTLIFEIHRVRPSLLLDVLPNICLQLQVDEVATRADAVKLLGRLFASRSAEYAQQFSKSFRDFLGRFRDASKEIRMLMVQAAVLVWENQPDLGHLLEKELVDRLNDPEWEVRQLVVRELCDLAANNLELVSEDCVRAVGERMKDKKVVLRKETMTGLGQVYGTHVAAYWNQSEDEQFLDADVGRDVPTDCAKKLGWIPDYVLKSYAYPQQELRLRVLQLLDDILLPKSFDDAVRAAGLIYMTKGLDNSSKEALRRIFKDRAVCRQAIIEFVADRREHREKRQNSSVSAEETESAASAAAQKLFDELHAQFPDTNNLRKILDQLSKWKDQSVFKHLEDVCDASTSHQDTRKARDEAVRCVGSKTALGDFLKSLCRKLAMLTVNDATVDIVVGVLADSEYPSRVTRSAADVLEIVSSVMPELLLPAIQSGQVDVLLVDRDEVLQKKNQGDRRKKATESEESEDGKDARDPKLVIGILKALANSSKVQTSQEIDGDTPISSRLSKGLTNFCLGNFSGALSSMSVAMQSEAARLSALILVSSRKDGQFETTSSLVHTLCARGHLPSSSASVLFCGLQSLRIIIKHNADIFISSTNAVSNLWSAVVRDFLPTNDTDGAIKATSPKHKKLTVPQLADARCLAIKVATNALVYLNAKGEPLAIPSEQCSSIIKTLFEVLRSDGKCWSSSAIIAAKYRAAASCALLKIARCRELEATMSVAEWHLLGFSMQDQSEDVRRAFLKRLTSLLIKHSVAHPHKYLSYLALAGTEPKLPLKKSAKALLRTAVERMRKTFESSTSSKSTEETDSETPEATRRANALLVPEYAVPYVIHLLAHHPDFPRALVEKHLRKPTAPTTPTSATPAPTDMAAVLESSMWSEQVAYLNFFMDGLVSSRQAASDNIAFVLQILVKLSQCRDALRPEALHIFPLIDTGAALLTKRIKNQANLKTFPGQIYVPKHLFTAPLPGSARSSVSSGPRKITDFLSPIKPAGGDSPFLAMQSPVLSLGGSNRKRRRARQLLPPTPENRRLTHEDNSNSEDEFRPSRASSGGSSRRESLMRQARAQVLSYADSDEAEGQEEDEDDEERRNEEEREDLKQDLDQDIDGEEQSEPEAKRNRRS